MCSKESKRNQALLEKITALNQTIYEQDRVYAIQENKLKKLQKELTNALTRKKTLNQRINFFNSFLDASPDLLYYCSEEGAFLGCNRAMELLVGKSGKQIIGLFPLDIYPMEVAEKVMETDERVLKNNVALSYEQWLSYPDGGKVCFEIRKVPFFDQNGKRQGLIGFGRDITERKRYQDALESASRDKTTFISTISHELRTPLNGIVGLSQILIDSDLRGEQLEYLKTIHVSAVTLGNIFNDIIEIDRLERCNIEINNQPVELNDFLSDLENLAGLLVRSNSLSFSLQVEGVLPTVLWLDDTRLRQILWNIISNAVKFTSQGEIKVLVQYDGSQEKLSFSVQDSGIGIPAEELERIFMMYYQIADNTGKRPVSGTGIGLAVSKKLAQIMGGDIDVKSTLGKGACFTVSLIAPVVGSYSVIQEEHSSALRILLVEDVTLNVLVAQKLLERLGHYVDVAMTGQQALQQFLPEKYDLVLLDIQLPDMTGFDIVKYLRHTFTQKLPPLIAWTANPLKNKDEYLSVGMDDVLGKPLSVKALTNIIRHYCHKHEKSIEVEPVMASTSSYSLVLDLDILQQYQELLDKSSLEKSVSLFKKLMPGYLSILERNMIIHDQKNIVEQAHKIKGAAASIGLKRLQNLAEKIQTPSLSSWTENVHDWINELKTVWESDLEILSGWIKK